MILHFRIRWSALIAALFLLPSVASAATLSFTPANTTVSVGSTITETVWVSSTDQAMNAISGMVSFPADLLQVVSVSTSNSVLSLWVQNPSFSNDDGTVSWSGIVPNPGYSGSNGQAVSIKFRGKDPGTATITFSSSSQVLANDGNGTDILTDMSPATVTVVPSSSAASTPSSSTIGSATITSPTHPDQTKWYNSTVAELDWNDFADATSIRIGYDKYPQGKPTVVYGPSVSSKSLSLGEGVWYFHVQEENASGWGPISTFRLQIDITPPNPIHIQFPDGSTSNDPQPLAIFNTTDNLSGVDYYVVALGGSSPIQIPAASITGNPYPLPVQGPGPGSVTITAYDKAGNSVSSQANFDVVGLNPPRLNPIADITVGQNLQISGTTYPSAQIEIFLKNKNGQTSSQTAQADTSGSFRVIWKNALDIDIYTVTAQATGSTGEKSTFSPAINFQVKESIFSIIGQFIINYLSLLLIILCVLIAFIFGIRYAWHHFQVFHNRLNSKLGHTHALLHQQFTELKDAVAEEVAALEKVESKRNLTVEEERFINRFRKMLDRSEETIEEEIDKIIK